MSARISRVQRQTLLAAGKTVKGMVRGVKSSTGTSLQTMGLGYYHEVPNHMFYLNGTGLRVVQGIENGKTWLEMEKEYLK